MTIQSINSSSLPKRRGRVCYLKRRSNLASSPLRR